MAQVLLYTKSGCPYSAGARRLLSENQIPFDEVNVTEHPERREEMVSRAGGRSTFPQVFIGDRHVGGYTELQELDRRQGVRTLLDAGENASP